MRSGNADASYEQRQGSTAHRRSSDFRRRDVAETTRRHGRRINHVHCEALRPVIPNAARQKDQGLLSAILDGVFTAPPPAHSSRPF
jgi:hypothetical protein